MYLKMPSLRLHQVNLQDKKYVRAGIIPYLETKGIRMFAFGVDACVACITDFGGHREKVDHDIVETAIREYREESFEIFGKITREQLMNCYVMEGKDTLEIFLPVTGFPLGYSYAFQRVIESSKDYEAQNLIWLTTRQTLLAFSQPNLTYEGIKIFHSYCRIRDTFLANLDHPLLQ